jgi:Acetyltransferase (GNAT) domain
MADAPNASLRRANPEDASDIAEIWSLGWRDGHLGFVPQELVEARTEESFRARAAERATEITVAVVDGTIAGFVIVVADEIEQVYVAMPYRGTGVADVLMREAEQQVFALTDTPRAGSPSLPAIHEPVPFTNEPDGKTRGRSSMPPPLRPDRLPCPVVDIRSTSDDNDPDRPSARNQSCAPVGVIRRLAPGNTCG